MAWTSSLHSVTFKIQSPGLGSGASCQHLVQARRGGRTERIYFLWLCCLSQILQLLMVVPRSVNLGKPLRTAKIFGASRGIILSAVCLGQNWYPRSTHWYILFINCYVLASTAGIWFSSYSLTSPTNTSGSNRCGEYDEREYSVLFQRRLDTFLSANAFHFQHIYCCNIWTKKDVW